MKFDDKFYLTDSQARGKNGGNVRNEINGRACIMQCTDFNEFIYLCKRSTGNGNIAYTIDFIDVILNGEMETQPSVQQISPPQPLNEIDTNRAEINDYAFLQENSRILRASIHQGSIISLYTGVQCCAMALGSIVRASILSPDLWNKDIYDENLIESDKIYNEIRSKDITIVPPGFISPRKFNNIRTRFTMYGKNFSINYDNDDASFYGNIDHIYPQDTSIEYCLEQIFEQHNGGIFISGSKCIAVLKYNDKFYFVDSHSCGSDGRPTGYGKACVIETDNIPNLASHCRNIVFRTRNEKGELIQHQFDLDYIDVTYLGDVEICEAANQNAVPENIERANPDVQMIDYENIVEDEEPFEEVVPRVDYIPIQTSVMGPIDCVQPVAENELDVSENLNQIKRKTKDNIVNVQYELKAEEQAWFHLFPYGINGFRQNRPVSITALDYYQYRVLGSDPRFQRNDYLFYALSMFDYYRVKSCISACCKKIEGKDGKVQDVHLYMKNLRGSAAYWRTALNELIALIRCLGPPQYFVTFSCNDLNWMDMRKALLIADGRPDVDPASLDLNEVQKLIEQYPVVVSRHFMIRVNALMKFIKSNERIFGGRVKDFWWRIEFQNRGSPHLHMVIWIENYPSFDTPEGIRLIDQVCSCRLPDENEDKELHDLVKSSQIHQHRETCQKNTTSRCRFNFPRAECEETHIVESTSDDFIRSGGRICILKRRKQDKWINNYNPLLLKLTKANMDIQPCGTNEAIAFYIAKYMSKSEPTELNAGVAEAIKLISREEGDISRKMFKICMRILRERQISACECAYRLCHLKLRDSSRSCIFLNTRKPEQRYKVISFDKAGRASGYCSNIFERYSQRPLSTAGQDRAFASFEMNKMNLTTFASLFEPHYAKNQEENEQGVDDDVYEDTDNGPKTKRPLLKLLDQSKMKLRNVHSAVRVPFFKVSEDEENYYYSLLVQYVPFRDENELLRGYPNAKQAFLARETELRQVSREMEFQRACEKQLETAFNQVHALQVLQEEAEPELENLEEMEQVNNDMTDDQFLQGQRAMNSGQRNIYNLIRENIQGKLYANDDNVSDPIRIFITGGGGVGKTFLLKMLRDLVNRGHGKNVVKICAITGVAARLVGGSTLHSTLKLPVQKDGRIMNMPPLTGIYLEQMMKIWRDTEFLFIDEISMVPYEMLCQIDARLRQLKNCDQPFGGINILLFGDLFQLPPVRGHQVFDQPKRFLPATHLWRLFRLYELTENMRQQGDTTFRDLLNALRVGELNRDQIRVFLSKVATEFTGDFEIGKALRIYPTNKQVQDHNDKVIQLYARNNTEMHKIVAQDQIVDETRNRDNVSMDNIIPTDINKTGGLPKELMIFKGAKVMLRSNIDVSKGLVNGAIGVITDIHWPHFRRGQIYAEDIPDVSVDFGEIGIHVIKPKSIQFPAKYSFGTAERRMLPLVLCWASTVHKMQGCSVDNAVVYLGSELFAEGQAYVALSRIRTLDGLLIEELDCEKINGQKPCNKHALHEMNRMRNQIQDK